VAKCKDCIHFAVCSPHTEPDESYPEVGGCPAFKSNDDFMEVVRCKDCKHYKPQSKSAHWNSKALYCCRSATVKMKPDDFCSYGERREGE
jgi:hypothetical protein